MDRNDFVSSIIGCGESTDRSLPSSGKKALVWARVSTDMQEDRGCSIPEQLREMRAYAKRHGTEIAEEFQEAASAFQKEHQRV